MSVVPESVPYYRVQFPRLSPSLLRAWSRILMLVSIYVVFHPFRCKDFKIIMGKNAVNIGQHYFHNEDLSEAKIHIMKIMLTDIHGIIIIMS